MQPVKSVYTYAGMLRARFMALSVGLFVVIAVLVGWLALKQGTAAADALAAVCGVFVAVAVPMLVINMGLAGVFFELSVRRRFRAVCRAKGLVVKGQRPNGKRYCYYPAVSRLTGSRVSFRMAVRPLHGQSVADFEKAGAAFAMAYGAGTARFRYDGSGRLLMVVGYQKLPVQVFEHRDAVPVAVGWRDQLSRVEVGVGEYGGPLCLPLLGSHVLVAGVTGAGKNSVTWSILLRLVPAMQAGVVRAWGFDPKRMELAIGREFFGDRYAAEPEAMMTLLERAHTEMLERADALAGHARKFEPSFEHPMELVVVDELGYLVALLPDRKQREHAEKMLSALLVLGRAVGFTVVGALQDPRKETLSFRDLFPTRVAMRLPKPMVDLVLGAGMYEAGAQCDLIPATEADGAGVAFVVDETSTQPVLLRTSWCSDEAIRQAAGRLDSSSSRRLSWAV